MASELEILEAEIAAHRAIVEVKKARFDESVNFAEFYELVEKFTEIAAAWEALRGARLEVENEG
ncbi:hypothetical protein [Ferrimicrobium sp.]|uniref:hypothetical protein n=1 Tax=Ferrimicrobium sp. TaxID=2926050 RepID=UPI0026398A8C|nr:hypothetical protein [Ferrimicrobium sp.]